MDLNDEIVNLFSEHIETFTIYVVERKFTLNRGREFFKKYSDREHFISDDDKIKKHLSKILSWIQKKIPDVATLTQNVLAVKTSPSPSGIVDIITSLNKLFTITEHQAVGPEVIDPIIIDELNITHKYIAELVALYKESIIQPAIIIILKDDDFKRAKKLLSNCPHNTNVKFIRNNGESIIYKIINNGAENTDDFVDAFSRQCFSTCSNTDRNILLNSNWGEENFIKSITPYFFKVRTNLLYDEKEEALTDVNYILNRITMERSMSNNNSSILSGLEIIAKLNRIYCCDQAGTDISDVLELQRTLDIDLVKAYIYRFAHFIPGINRNRQKELLLEATQIFKNNNVADHAMYCQNNYLVHSFYSNRVHTREFKELQQRAVYEVPGMVGMSIIFNNVGVAYLYNREFSEALTYFRKGLDYSKERMVQRIGLQSNILITKASAYEKIDEKEIRILLETVLANFSGKYLPFIAANYIMNILFIALEQHNELGREIFYNPKVQNIISSALKNNTLGSGSLIRQIVKLQSKFGDLDFSIFTKPINISSISGIREEFIMEKGYNPIIFNAWL